MDTKTQHGHTRNPSIERDRDLARKRTLARIRSLREQANRLERILNGGKP